MIFFDYVKEWSCLCDIFFRYSGGGGGGGRRGVHSKEAFVDGFYLLGGRSFEGAFIQSITVIRTC